MGLLGRRPLEEHAPLYRRNWTLKPAGEAYRELVLKTWRTDVAGKTDADGRFGTRAFYGEYEVYVSFSGRQKTLKIPHKPAMTGVASAKRKGVTKTNELKGVSTVDQGLPRPTASTRPRDCPCPRRRPRLVLAPRAFVPGPVRRLTFASLRVAASPRTRNARG